MCSSLGLVKHDSEPGTRSSKSKREPSTSSIQESTETTEQSSVAMTAFVPQPTNSDLIGQEHCLAGIAKAYVVVSDLGRHRAAHAHMISPDDPAAIFGRIMEPSAGATVELSLAYLAEVPGGQSLSPATRMVLAHDSTLPMFCATNLLNLGLDANGEPKDGYFLGLNNFLKIPFIAAFPGFKVSNLQKS